MPTTEHNAELLHSLHPDLVQVLIELFKYFDTLVIGTNSRIKILFCYYFLNEMRFEGVGSVLGDFEGKDAAVRYLESLDTADSGMPLRGKRLVQALIPTIHDLIHNGDNAYVHEDEDVPLGSFLTVRVVNRSVREGHTHDVQAESENKALSARVGPGELAIAMDTVATIRNPGETYTAFIMFLESFRENAGRIGKLKKTYEAFLDAVVSSLRQPETLDAQLTGDFTVSSLITAIFNRSVSDIQQRLAGDISRTKLSSLLSLERFLARCNALFFENDPTYFEHAVGITVTGWEPLASEKESPLLQEQATILLLATISRAMSKTFNLREDLGFGGTAQLVQKESATIFESIAPVQPALVLSPQQLAAIEKSDSSDQPLSDEEKELVETAWIQLLSHEIGFPIHAALYTLGQFAEQVAQKQLVSV